MYYRRFVKEIAEGAHALLSITTEQYIRILDFYDSDTFILKGQAAVNILRFHIPEVEQIKYDEDNDLYSMKVLEWPHHKKMCLFCKNQNPCKWKYLDDKYNELFDYHIDTFSIFSPTAVLGGDKSHSLGHGSD